MDNLFNFFAQIGDIIIYLIIIFAIICLYFLYKRMYKALSKRNSETKSRIISIFICVIIGLVSIFCIICSRISNTNNSNNISVIYYDKELIAGDTMHIVFKGKPDTLYEIEFEEGKCESKAKKSNNKGYVTYTFKTTKTNKGEDSFYIYDCDDIDINTDYTYFSIK